VDSAEVNDTLRMTFNIAEWDLLFSRFSWFSEDWIL
jgi:hypothetical protein